MPSDTKVTLYYGPVSWFKEQTRCLEAENLLDIVYERDESRREIRVIPPGQEPTRTGELDEERPANVVAESGDYASLTEHTLTNFSGLVHSIHPENLFLHNPPRQVHNQLERTYDITTISVSYKPITRDALLKFRHKFSSHLVGQRAVREAMLAAMYPLTRPNRAKPVVVMFYGPSGVGKTETAKLINDLLGGCLFRKQFSMLHSDKFASYLFGGGHQEPSLARDLLDRESGVILLDEFDKANPIFHSAFYEFFDEGALEDKNYRVEVGSSLILCTSNYSSEKEISDSLGEALYSRFDAFVRFEPLSQPEVVEVIDRLVERKFQQLEPEEKRCIDIELIKERLYGLRSRLGNIRQLGKTVDQMIATLLVRELLADPSSPLLNVSTASRDDK